MSVPGLIPPGALAWASAPQRHLADLMLGSRRLSRASLLIWEAVADARTRVGGRTAQACAERLAWLAGELCAVHGIHVDREGELPEGPVVLVANHVGYLDPMVMLSQIPALPIAKRELGDWPLLGRALEPLGVSLVRRGDPYDGARALRRAAAALEDGVGVLVYPEGTTTGGASVLPLRRGMFGVARRLGIPVVPVVLRYESPSVAWVGEQWFVPHYARVLATSSLRVRLTIGNPITSRQDPRSFARYVRHRMIAMLDRSARPRLVHAA